MISYLMHHCSDSGAHFCSQCHNHSSMTHPSKTDCHQLSGIAHWVQQRVDSGQEWFSTELLTLGTGVSILFCMTETWWHASVHWQQGKYWLWGNCFMRQMPVANWRPQILKEPPTVVASVLTTRPWPIHQKRIGTRWVASHIGKSSESIRGRNDLPLSCLHLALAYRYYFFYEGDMITYLRAMAAR